MQSIAETEGTDFHDLVLDCSMETSLGESQRTGVLNIPEHIIDVRANSHPVPEIKSKTTIDLTDTTGTGVGFGEMIIGVYRI